MHDLLNRQPPFDLDAEIGVIGSMILKPDVCDVVSGLIDHTHFFDDANQRLFAVLFEMHTNGDKLDPTLLVAKLKQRGEFELIGGTSYLSKIAVSVPVPSHARYYAEIVRRMAVRRAMIDVGYEITQAGFETTDDPEGKIAEAEQTLSEIRDTSHTAEPEPIKNAVSRSLDALDRRMTGQMATGQVSTGYHALDQKTGGLHAGELTILAGRPSMGKTAFAISLIENVCKRGDKVLFFSIEMPDQQVADRMLSSVARVNSQQMRNGTILDDDRRKIVEASADVASWPLEILDSPSIRASQIASYSRRAKRQKGVDLIVVDYLQFMDCETGDVKSSRSEQVGNMAKILRAVARHLKIPILVVAQLNRDVATDKSKIPQLHHLGESGKTEQHADNVWFVHRPSYYIAEPPHGKDDPPRTDEEWKRLAYLMIRKQRQGITDDIEFNWLREFTRFELPNAANYSSDFEDFNERDW